MFQPIFRHASVSSTYSSQSVDNRYALGTLFYFRPTRACSTHSARHGGRHGGEHGMVADKEVHKMMNEVTKDIKDIVRE